jgi:hypothetical protein
MLNGQTNSVGQISKVLKFADRSKLIVTLEGLQHLQAHPEITTERLSVAASKIQPKAVEENQLVTIDLESEYGKWGVTNLIKLDKTINPNDSALFQIRKGRKHPSHVVKGKGKETSLMTVCFQMNDDNTFILKTAFASSGHNPGKEPITPSIDPNIEGGRLERLTCLEEWCKYALVAEEGLEVFTSSWYQVLHDYGDVYHS